jgi:hypothetical protein
MLKMVSTLEVSVRQESTDAKIAFLRRRLFALN